LSLHWRRVPPSWRRHFHRVITQALAPDVKQRRIQLTTGKRVIEVRPPGHWHKGAILTWLLKRIPRSRLYTRAMTVYFGDDQTDEAAFHTINRMRGVSVFVGSRPRATAARWWVRSPGEVQAALAGMLEAL
jgi:trehalose 6-phosphate phosphatase